MFFFVFLIKICRMTNTYITFLLMKEHQVAYFNRQIYRERKIFLPADSLKPFCTLKRNIATKCFMLVQIKAMYTTKTLCNDIFLFRVKLFLKK